ncbi:uncharacterized protein [Solanum lycopersicum]|uniref:uncharacterized protein n=1 Tax=Solanum lycopersicum TaxID=4081 RepID=UPI003747D924
MGRIGCTIDGNLNDSEFSQPMPWIGVYVAAASAACALGMAMDAFHGLRHRKFWFPCNFFSLNATTLTLLAVATKLSVDLNTSMPRQQDQLTKLSSAALICTVIANFMPSLGLMENQELLMNIMALGIFVITAIVNIGIQLATGVIYVFFKEHIALMFLMLVLLLLLISSAVTIPTTKRYLDLKYKKKYKLANKECNIMGTCTAEKLKYELMKFWTMAYTSCPHFVGGRLVTCTASGVFCLMSTGIYADAMFRSYILHKSFNFCSGDSEYKWSSTLILVTHTVAIGVGAIAPAFRWFRAINFNCPKKANNACKLKLFKVENYWIRILLQWKECPLDFRYCGRHGKKFAHKSKNKLLDLCILVQIMMVSLSKLVRLVSIFSVSQSLIYCRKAIKMLKCYSMMSSLDTELGSQTSSKPDLSCYALHLEGEEALIDLMMQSNSDLVNHWIGIGKKKQPKHLLRLLEKLKSSPGFRGVHKFDSAHIPSLNSENPPNCWALPVVTLTSIAIALPNINFHSIKELIKCVNEGLMYIKVVEDNLDARKDLANIRRAAELVWLEVDLCYKWLDVDLRKIATEGQNPKHMLESLSEKAKQRFIEFRKKDSTVCPKESPSKWPINMLAANSMYRICQTLLVSSDSIEFENSKIMFDKLSSMITDITGACLTNLQRVMQCHHGTITERSKGVRSAILLLGKAENILEILRSQPLPSSVPDQLSKIDHWCTLSKEEDYLSCSRSSTSNCTPTSQSSSDLYLNVD